MQFESTLSMNFGKCLKRHGITAYHPQSSDILELWHWTLKAALMASDDPCLSSSSVFTQSIERTSRPAPRRWCAERTADPVLDIKAGLSYSGMLCLPRDMVSKLRPPSRYTTPEVDTPKNFVTRSQVLIRVDIPQRPLHPTYESPLTS